MINVRKIGIRTDFHNFEISSFDKALLQLRVLNLRPEILHFIINTSALTKTQDIEADILGNYKEIFPQKYQISRYVKPTEISLRNTS